VPWDRSFAAVAAPADPRAPESRVPDSPADTPKASPPVLSDPVATLARVNTGDAGYGDIARAMAEAPRAGEWWTSATLQLRHTGGSVSCTAGVTCGSTCASTARRSPGACSTGRRRRSRSGSAPGASPRSPPGGRRGRPGGRRIGGRPPRLGGRGPGQAGPRVPRHSGTPRRTPAAPLAALFVTGRTTLREMAGLRDAFTGGAPQDTVVEFSAVR
jgi:hypothetical protein